MLRVGREWLIGHWRLWTFCEECFMSRVVGVWKLLRGIVMWVRGRSRQSTGENRVACTWLENEYNFQNRRLLVNFLTGAFNLFIFNLLVMIDTLSRDFLPRSKIRGVPVRLSPVALWTTRFRFAFGVALHQSDDQGSCSNSSWMSAWKWINPISIVPAR